MKNILRGEKIKKDFIIGMSIFTMGVVTVATVPYKDVVKDIKSTEVIQAKASKKEEFRYLSDISYVSDLSSTAYGSITYDKTIENGKNGYLITLIINGKKQSFFKGIMAHANSTVVYDLDGYDYDYFTTYVGLDESRGTNGNGVKFAIYTSVDGETWDLVTNFNNKVYKGDVEADFVSVDIKNVRYLKLVANNNGNMSSDHAVYANAKLIKEGYTEDTTPVSFIKTVEEYDSLIKTNTSNNLEINNELLLLQRDLVNSVGYDMLQMYAKYSDDYKETLNWLMNTTDVLRYYIIGGAPAGSYLDSLKVLNELYHAYKDDFNITATTKYGTVLGDLYKRMAISLSLTHSAKVALWMQPAAVENQSDAVTRYAIYKNLHKEGKFVVADDLDITKWFEKYNVEEMRFVMNNLIDDEEIVWLNEYVQYTIDNRPSTNSYWSYLTPHPYMAYVWPNYSNDVYYDDANYDYFNDLFAVGDKKLYDYGITRGTKDYKLYKVWMNFRNKFGTGAVCGGISKTGSNIRATHGIPATVIGQPGHAAILYYTENSDGKGYWNIDNNVSGWTLSEKGERMLLGWGNAAYSRGYSVTYMVLAQEALNDFENYQKSKEFILLSNTYKGDLVKQEECLRKALKSLNINIDAWYNLITLYNSDETKTEEDYFNLAVDIAQNLKEFPLPMYHLLKLIKPKLTSAEYIFKITLLETKTLEEGKDLQTGERVLQPAITRTMANYLLGQTDNSLANFSFDGDNAGKIMLSDKFNGTGVRWDYSIDGKLTWKEVFSTADEEHSSLLTASQIDSITADNDIYVHIVGTDYNDDNVYKIDILNQNIPDIIYNNDLENKVMGITDVTEWRMDGSDTWTLFKDSTPDLTGDKTVYVREGKHGVYLISSEMELAFTNDVINDKRKYITIDHLSLKNVSSEATAQNRYAKYMIDGNAKTSWHSAWNGSDRDKYITIELDKYVKLSAVEYLPAGGGNGKILSAQILGSVDGENWTEIVSETNWANNDTLKSVEISEPALVKYIKIVGKKTGAASASLSFMAGKMFNFYEDVTNPYKPAAEISYDITTLTNNSVTAKVVNSNVPITITNNNALDTVTFTENGDFTFEFVDSLGNTGSATALVDWIDKKAPTADVAYSTTNKTTGKVIATLTNPSESITILNNNGKNSYEFTKNGEFTFEYVDKAGNKGTTRAIVDWIIENNTNPSGPINIGITADPDDNKPSNVGNNTNNTTNKNDKPVSSENNSKDDKKPNIGKVNNNTTVVKNSDLNSGEDKKAEEQVKPVEKYEEDIDLEEYQEYNGKNLTVKLPVNTISEIVNLKVKDLTLSDKMQEKIGGQNEFFEVYFVTRTDKKMGLNSLPIKMTLKIDPNKELLGIYEVKGEEYKALDYKRISADKVVLNVTSLESYIISYKEEEQPKEEFVIDTKEENQVEKNEMTPAVISFGILALLVALSRIVKNKKETK